MPMYAEGKTKFLLRIRRDESQPNTINMWVVADNRKGAATNTIQIAEYLRSSISINIILLKINHLF
jgi:aspartate-semialdehyde dehydrogenase